MPIEKIKYRQLYKESIDRFELSNDKIYLLLKAFLANQLPLRHLAKGCTKKIVTRCNGITDNAYLETIRKKTIHATN